jgi:hypothetical protein
MNYTVASDNFEAKKNGESITEKELLELGLDIPALVAGEHIKKTTTAIKPATEKEAE